MPAECFKERNIGGNMKKLAVVFPGMGYHGDKPLLYYSKKIAAGYGFEVVEVPYGNFPKDVKGSAGKMEQAFRTALEQSGEILKNVDFEQYDRLLFLSKSIGTAVAAAFGESRGLRSANVYYTPVEASLRMMSQPGIVFHGTKDSWAETEPLLRICREKNYEVHLVENANHSLETGDVLRDLENMGSIMSITEKYIRSAAEES